MTLLNNVEPKEAERLAKASQDKVKQQREETASALLPVVRLWSV